jgi:hypothetical protein
VLRQALVGAVLPVALVAISACTGGEGSADTPGLVDRGTPMTTTTPTRQDLTNRVSLTGTVTLNPVYGLAAPVAGQIRYLSVQVPSSTPTRPTRVANIYVGSTPTRIEVPAGSTFAGRLVDDRSPVSVGMPIVSAKYAGYGIVASIDGAQAYQISDTLTSVTAQITNGPGPFPCTVLGTIAALPAGTIPDPPVQQPPAGVDPTAPPVVPVEPGPQQPPSEATGMRLVCLAPADVKLINGAAATIEVVTESATNVLVLPVEAVAGSRGNGKVTVVLPDGSTEVRDVVLGLSDGEVVEIKSGLTGDETVAIPGPNLPPAPPQQGGDPGMPPVKRG